MKLFKKKIIQCTAISTTIRKLSIFVYIRIAELVKINLFVQNALNKQVILCI